MTAWFALALSLAAGILAAVLVIGRSGSPRPGSRAPIAPSRWRGHQ